MVEGNCNVSGYACVHAVSMLDDKTSTMTDEQAPMHAPMSLKVGMITRREIKVERREDIN